MGSHTDEARAVALQSLRHPRGRYPADRASQLSGIPISTIYDWQRHGIYVPDYRNGRPMAWSYRDLVYLRVLAWLRSEGMPRPEAAEHVRHLRAHVSSGHEVHELRADRTSFLPDGDVLAPFNGASVLFPDMLARFDLVGAAVEEIDRERIWGPDLVTPSERTYISPWVLGGDPCIDETRIQTASVFALREDRGLEIADVIELFPDLEADAVDDAHRLERRLRGLETVAAA